MPAIYEYDAARDIVIGRLSGLITTDEVLNATARVIDATDGLALRRNVLVLVDEDAMLQNIDMAMMTKLKDLVLDALARFPGGRHVKTAIVTQTSIGISVFKMWEVLSDLYPMGTQTRIFADEGHALAWFAESGDRGHSSAPLPNKE